MKILVVDDELVSREKMRVVMARYGATECAGDGEAALKAFKCAWEAWKPFDLISLDISMPGMDGAQVLKRIRDIEKEKGVAPDKRVNVMMVTGHADRDTVIACKMEGCDDYVVKPFDSGTVAQKLMHMGLLNGTSA